MKTLFFKITLSIIITLFSSCSSSDDTESDTEVFTSEETSMESEILRLLNEHRASMELDKLITLDVIKSQTDKHTDYMIAKNKISHDNFDERRDYLKEKTNALSAAENVAYGYSSAKSVVEGWLSSNGHKNNIEGNYTHFNITAKKNKENVWYYTNIFIKK